MDTPEPNGLPANYRQCTAKSKQSGQRCKRRAAVGREVCAMHGGKSLSGIAHPRFKTGLYSKAIPQGLKEEYKRALADPDLLSLDREVALLSVRASELIEQLGQAEAPPWGQAVETLNDLAAALRSGEKAQVDEAFAAHSEVIRSGAAAGRAYESTWRELREVIQDKAKVARAEWSRLTDLQGVITAAQAMTLITSLLEAVRSHVQDRATLQRIQETFNRLLSGNGQVIEGRLTHAQA